jgi:hypothetical protein
MEQLDKHLRVTVSLAPHFSAVIEGALLQHEPFSTVSSTQRIYLVKSNLSLT